MRVTRRRESIAAMPRAVLLSLLLALVAVPAAGAAQVSYVDGAEVWVSTLDGSAKRSLSGPSPDEKPWQEQTQSDAGHVLGVRREGGKQGQFNATRLWGPDGALAGEGTLTMKTGYNVNAYPVTLDLTPDGRTVVFGYSLSRFTGQFEAAFGTMAMSSSGQYTQGIDIPDAEGGTLAGTRVVGHDGNGKVVISPPGAGPFAQDFTQWMDSGATNVSRTDVAADGSMVAVETWGNAVAVDREIALVPIAGPGGASDDLKGCYLDTEGEADNLSIAPDATSMAWEDDRGVVVAGTPVWFETPDIAVCRLSRPPVVISATGKMPAIGGSTAATPPVTGGIGQNPPALGTPGGGSSPSGTTPGGAGGAGGGPRTQPRRPVVVLARRVKASALRTGIPVTVTVAGAGTVTVTGKVGKATVGRASRRVRAAGRVRLTLKASRKARRKLRRYAGETLTLTIRGPGGTTTARRELR